MSNEVVIGGNGIRANSDVAPQNPATVARRMRVLRGVVPRCLPTYRAYPWEAGTARRQTTEDRAAPVP